MLELYHHGSSVCAAKVRLVLGEKQLPWEGHYLDILKGDQFRPEYVRLNPKAVVPTLVHDGQVVLESTVIAEYLDDVFSVPSLRPTSALDRAQMRLWTKSVDEVLHPACAEVTFASCHRHIINRLPPEEHRRFLESTPPDSVTPEWHARKKEIVLKGFAAPRIADKFRAYDRQLQRMEEQLATSRWLAGDTFSLADIGVVPYVNRLDMLGMSEMWTSHRRRVTDWFARIRARPTFSNALLEWCPPDLTADLWNFGSASWPEANALL